MLYGRTYFVVGEVFAAQVKAETRKFACHLCLQLQVGRVGGAVVEHAAAIELPRHVKLPYLHRCLIGECEQSLVARGERFAPQHTVVGAFHIVEAESPGGSKSAEEGICGINLQGMAVALALQVFKGERVFALFPVKIDDHLVGEVGVVVFGIDFQLFAKDGQVEHCRQSHVPCLLLLELWVDEHRAAAGQ